MRFEALIQEYNNGMDTAMSVFVRPNTFFLLPLPCNTYSAVPSVTAFVTAVCASAVLGGTEAYTVCLGIEIIAGAVLCC